MCIRNMYRMKKEDKEKVDEYKADYFSNTGLHSVLKDKDLLRVLKECDRRFKKWEEAKAKQQESLEALKNIVGERK